MSSLPTATLGTLLKRYRRAAGLTQEALAEQAGISADTISDLERGVNLRPRSDTIDRLADALGLAPPQHAQLQAAARGLVPPGEPAVMPLHLSAASASLPTLVGRKQELARLARHLAGEGPPLLLLAGEPGIGKSRLLDEARHQAPQMGWSVLAGGCHRKSGQEPFTPLLTALAGSLRNTSPVALRTRLEGCAWLVRLLPELAETRLLPSAHWTLPPEQERRLMFAAVARYLANVAGPAGTLLVLDDLQWAGADALDLLESLLRTPGETPLRVVAAYRSTEVRPPDPLGGLLADLGAAGLAVEARLLPLAKEEASVLLQSLLAGREEADETLRERLIVRTGGVPYFLVSCAESLRAGVEVRSPVPDVPWNVAQSIGQRVAALPPAAHELLGAAAVVGREAPGALLLALAGQPTAETVTALEALDRARLLVEGAEGRYQFPHDLIREAVLSELSAVRRASLHGHVAAALEQGPARRLENRPKRILRVFGLSSLPEQGPARRRESRAAELAWHWQEAGDAGRALPYALLAGEQAEAVYAHRDAERHYQTARDLARELGDQRREAEALEQLGLTVRFLRRHTQAVETQEAALALYQATGDVEEQGRVLARLGHFHVAAGNPEAGAARLQPLVAPLCAAGLSIGGQAALLTALAWLYFIIAESSGTMALYDEALSAAEQAEALAEQAQDERLLGQARVRRGSVLLRLEREEEGVQVLEDAMRLIEASGELVTLTVALYQMSNFYYGRGQYDLALVSTERALAIAERLGDLDNIAFHQRRRGEICFALGRWEQARHDLEQAALLVGKERVSSERFRSHLFWSHLLLGRLSLAQGQAEAAAEYFQRALALTERSTNPTLLFWGSCAVAEQDLVEGHPEAARARLEPFLDHAPLRAGERASVRHLLGWAYVDLGDLERAEALLTASSTLERAHLRPWAVLGVLRSQARLALRQGRGPEAEHALAEALALAQAIRTPYDEAQTLYLYGLLYLRQDEAKPARERLEAALALCAQLGDRLYARQIEQVLAKLGPQEEHIPS
jgi:tetratricopeptide (TPR) repeat protein/transcriptional regulator with XRE-family HTH domain